MELVCANSAKCPIFSGVLQGKEITSKSYRNKYCEAGAEGWENCKRYLIKAKYGTCPPDLLPNSALTIAEIAAKYNLSAI